MSPDIASRYILGFHSDAPGYGFGQALNALQDGLRVARDGWDDKSTRIEMQRPDAHSKMTEPYLYLCFGASRRVPWAPSQTDVVAFDWRVLPPEAP